MRLSLPKWISEANPLDPVTERKLRERERELMEELAEGGYTKKYYEIADRRELKEIRKLLRSV